MVDHIKHQLRAQGVEFKTGKGNTRATAKSPTQQAAGSKSVGSDAIGQRDTPKEVASPRPGTGLRWEKATGEFPKQYPGMVRAVLLCPDSMWPQVEAALIRIQPPAQP